MIFLTVLTKKQKTKEDAFEPWLRNAALFCEGGFYNPKSSQCMFEILCSSAIFDFTLRKQMEWTL